MLVYVLAGHEVLGRIAVGRRALRRSQVRLRDPLFSRRYVLARVRGLGTEARWLEIEPRDVMVVHRLPGFRDTFP